MLESDRPNRQADLWVGVETMDTGKRGMTFPHAGKWQTQAKVKAESGVGDSSEWFQPLQHGGHPALIGA